MDVPDRESQHARPEEHRPRAAAPVLFVGDGPPSAGILTELSRTAAFRLQCADVAFLRAASSTGTLLERDLAGTAAVVCCLAEDDALVPALVRACRLRRVPLVTVLPTPDGVVVGPVVSRPGAATTAGCPLCAARYRAGRRHARAAAGGATAAVEVGSASGDRASHAASPDAHAATLTLLALLAALDPQLTHLRAGGRALALTGDVPAPVRVPRHPACPACYPRVARGLRASRVRAERRWHAYWRSPVPEPLPLPALRERLLPFVAGEYGLFAALRSTPPRERQAVWRFFRERGVDPVPNAVAAAHHALLLPHDAARHAGAGEALDFDDPAAVEALALLEGMERRFSLHWLAPSDVVRTRWRDVAADALDPRAFPLCADEQYRSGSTDLVPFAPDLPLPWVWGVRLPGGEPVLVPLALVAAVPAPFIYRATSSGASCHGSVHHALLNAIQEVIERDAFMLAWLQRLSLPRIARPLADPYAVADSFRALSLETTLVDITTDLGIPVALALLRDRLDPDFFLLDMVCALDPVLLQRKLARELTQFAWPYFVDRTHYRRNVTLSATFDHVRSFPDHLAFYQRRDRNAEAAFLGASPSTAPFPALPAPPADVPGALAFLLERLAAHGHEVIAVDCTPRLLDRLGLCVVKVLIPGLLPLTAGHRNRVLGGRRLFEAPQRMGAPASAATVAELNAWPHPFW